MSIATSSGLERKPRANGESDSQVKPGSGVPFLWDVEDALTRVSYGLFRHVKNQTQPDESELVDWWHQILNSQVAIGALVAECEHVLSGTLQDDMRQRLAMAVARMGSCWSGVMEDSCPARTP